MNFQELRYFLVLSQELHFIRAAQKLNITQPTLSQAIQSLEKSLGAVLFERGPKQVTLTAQGRKFLPHVLSVIEELKLASEEIQDKKGPLRDTVSLGVIPTICPYLVPRVLIRLRREAPFLSLVLQELTTSLLVQFLKEGRLELGLLSLPLKEKAVATSNIITEPFYLAVPAGHALASRSHVTLKNIVSERLLVLKEGHCFGEQALAFCRLERKDEKVIFQGDSLSSVLKLVEAGQGVTLVPKMAIEENLEKPIRFIPFADRAPSRTLGIAWRVTHRLSRAQQFVIDVIENELKTG